MKTRMWSAAAIALGLASAIAGAHTVSAIYQDGNLLWRGAALLLPVAGVLLVYRDPGKRILAALLAVLLVSGVTCTWLAVDDELGSFALLSVVLVGFLVPIGVDLMLLDAGRRIAVSSSVAVAALVAFGVAFAPLATQLLSRQHEAVIATDWALIREVVQHVKVRDNAIVFDHVDPKHKRELKNRLAVRSEGKTYPLSNAHFESVSRESTVQKRTEKRGSSETTVVSRERKEEMRVVVDVDQPPTDIFLQSARGPVTVYEEQIWPSGDEWQDPVS